MKSLKCFALGFALLLAGTGMPAFEAELSAKAEVIDESRFGSEGLLIHKGYNYQSCHK